MSHLGDRPVLFVTSWDDGHPADLRLAEMLARHGLCGTFFVPQRNSERRPVLSLAERRELDLGFEVASHTLDHVYLRGLPAEHSHRQIVDGKDRLENDLGHAVDGFCYPGGKRDKSVVAQVKAAGFAYARTTENLRTDTIFDTFTMPTTMQFYPHGRKVLTRNLIRHGQFRRRGANWVAAVAIQDWLDRLRRLTLKCHDQDDVFHLWGHSWEIDKLDLWGELDQFLSWVSALKPENVTVAQLVATRHGHGSEFYANRRQQPFQSRGS